VSITEAAAFLAQQWPVFPCNANKQPLTEHGLHDAVSGEAAARALFHRPGVAMIGVPTGAASGFVVIDLDVKDGRPGLEWLAANEHRIPPTRRHGTKSGGVHLLFEHPAGRRIRNSASRIAPGVDVRGDGGYVIVPPSPGYSITSDAMPAPLPAWLLETLDPPAPAPAPVQPRKAPVSGDGSPYGLAALDAETSAILSAPFGQQETTLNAACLKIGALVAGGELAGDVALSALVSAALGMASQPGRERWDPSKVTAKVRASFADGQARPRNAPPLIRRTVEEFAPSWPEPPPHDEPPEHWGAEPDPRPAAEAPIDRRTPVNRDDTFPVMDIAALLALPPPEWLVDGILTTTANACLYGPYASLKSFAALDLSLCLAYGIPWQGRPVKRCAVLYIAGEGVRGVGKRVKAWLIHHGLEEQSGAFRLVSAAIDLRNTEVTGRVVRTALKAAEDDGVRAGLVVIDTLARAMVGADENSSQDMGLAVQGTDQIREGIEAATLTVHHTGKDSDKGPRGSSALGGAVDCQIRVERAEMSVTLTIEKQKDDEEGEPITLTAQKVALDGGELTETSPTSLVLVASDAGASPSARPSGRLSVDQQAALKVLHDALAEAGEPDFPGVPHGQRSIPEAWWRDRFYSRCKPGADQDTKKRAFRRAADALAATGKVGANRGRIWAL
jgi:hypothetical protein